MRATLALLFALAAAPAAGDVAVPAVRWRAEAAGLDDARRLHRPAVLLFSADWCLACKELERHFADRRVARAIERRVAIRVDCTDGDAAEETMKRWRVQALPTMILLDAAGKERRRVAHYLDAGELAAWLGG
jgi:thiol:disulfide interchange protein